MDDFATNRRGFLGGMAAGSIASRIGGFPAGALDGEGVDARSLAFTDPPAGLYLKIDGIRGDSTSESHEEEIDLFSVNWVVSRENRSGTGRGTTAPRFDPLVVTKGIDRATPKLMEFAVTGAQRPEAVLSLTRAVDGGEVDVYTVTLGNVQALTFENGSGIETGSIEVVSLTFDSIEVTHWEQNDDGSPGAVYTFGWDVKEKRPIE